MSDDLVTRLRELRSNQYADPNTAPEFVFLDPDLPPSEWEKQYGMDVVYVRADRIEELEAKLAKAVDVIDWALICWDEHNKHGYMMQGDWVPDARATLAELKGKSDE